MSSVASDLWPWTTPLPPSAREAASYLRRSLSLNIPEVAALGRLEPILMTAASRLCDRSGGDLPWVVVLSNATRTLCDVEAVLMSTYALRARREISVVDSGCLSRLTKSLGSFDDNLIGEAWADVARLSATPLVVFQRCFDRNFRIAGRQADIAADLVETKRRAGEPVLLTFLVSDDVSDLEVDAEEAIRSVLSARVGPFLFGLLASYAVFVRIHTDKIPLRFVDGRDLV